MKKILMICLFFAISIMVQTAQAEIYKWVDEQGRTHYGDKAVENSEQLEVSVKPESNTSSGLISQSRQERRQKLLDAIDEDNDREQKEETKKRKNKQLHKRRCNEAKDNLQRRERAGYLYTLDKDGNRVVTSTEKRQKDSAELRKNIKKYCK